jgi:8-oxo-dGTP diphosphatase
MRELKEETGLSTAYMKQFHIFSAVDRDPRERVLTVAFNALVQLSAVQGGDDAASAKWFPISEVPQLAFDHAEILQDGHGIAAPSDPFRAYWVSSSFPGSLR